MLLAVAQHTGGHQGVGSGDVGLGQQVAQGLAARRTAHTAAEVDDGALGLVDHGGGFLHVLLIIRGNGADQLRLFGGELADRGGDVLGDVHQYRAFAAGLGNAESRTHRVGQILDPAHGVVMFGDGHRDALDVGFLEGVFAQQGGGHVAGEGDHGHAVHVGGGDAGDQVGGTGAAGGQHHAGAARGAGVTVGRMGSALLVGGQHVADSVRIFVQLIVQIQNRAAGVAEQGIHALLDQDLDEDL